MTTKEEIETVHGSGGHVVLLGAGATLASTLRNPEKGKKKLPLMNNIIEVVGLQNVVKHLPKELKKLQNDFEKFYSKLCSFEGIIDEREYIEEKIYQYFESMDLPDEPTIYDYLILSLRHHKDTIATFNWDPFLYKAYLRNGIFTPSPGILFLHGNVSIGYNSFNRSSGPAGWTCKNTFKDFVPTKLLYPVEKKNYNSDEYIKGQWDSLQWSLKSAECVTVFGYSAPKSDVEAIELLQNAWGHVNERSMEQFEFIDVQDEDKVLKSWETFVHSHHYFYSKNYFDSSLATHPRRTVESFHNWAMPTTLNEAFQDGNQVPDNFRTLEEMWEWHRPLIEAEEKFYQRVNE
jgi:hypothetical protein